GNVGRRVGEAGDRPEARVVGEIACPSGARQDADRGVEAEPPRLGEEALVSRTQSRHQRRTRIPARAGHLAAWPPRPRSTTFVRTKELTVACSARKRSITEARR